MAKKQTLYDPMIGTLTWDPVNHWAVALPVGYFSKFGSDMPVFEDAEKHEEDGELKGLDSATSFLDMLMQTDEMKAMSKQKGPDGTTFGELMQGTRNFLAATEDRSFDPDNLFAQGKFLVSFRTRDKKPPTAEQREAWQRLTADEGVFDRVMTRVLEVYRRQRPVRTQWWKAMYSDSPEKLLPDAKNVKALAKVVRPIEFRVHEDGESIGIHFDSAWHQGDGFGVLLRNGEIADIGEKEVALELPSREKRKTIDHPDFGTLKQAGKWEWSGRVRFEPFRAFYNVAEERESLRRSGFKPDELPRSSAPWDFAEGEFGLTVFVKEGQAPSAAQADAFRAFMADERKSADIVLAAILENYRKSIERPRKGAKKKPEASLDALHDQLTFHGLAVFAPKPKKSPAIGLSFACSWDPEHGLSVRWRDGKIELVGQADEAAD